MKYPDDFHNKIICGDCLDVMRTFEDNSIDTIITDPPYGLSFMGKKWDYEVPSIEVWRECLRVLKPGGTALIFAGSRTQHRMAVNIEDAGFILKDTIMWLYGSGFPKATDIGKQIDKLQGNEREEIGIENKAKSTFHSQNVGGEITKIDNIKITKGNTEWEGYKSHGLKPAYEPIIIAMKPNEGSYANNALKWGVAGLNVDGGRIGHNEDLSIKREGTKKLDTNNQGWGFKAVSRDNKGRFPANIILDEEAARLLDEQSGVLKSGGGNKANIKPKSRNSQVPSTINGGDWDVNIGGASRFFYCAKASKKERNRGCDRLEDHNPCYESHRPNYKNTKGIETPYAGTGRSGNNLKNNHPTVKPLALMKYLVTLTMMPNPDQVYLDPFCGSGTTLMAVKELGRNYIGIEKEKEYIKIAKCRVNATPEPLFV